MLQHRAVLNVFGNASSSASFLLFGAPHSDQFVRYFSSPSSEVSPSNFAERYFPLVVSGYLGGLSSEQNCGRHAT